MINLWISLQLRSGILIQFTSIVRISYWLLVRVMVEFYAKYHVREYNLRPYLRKRPINPDHTKDQPVISPLQILINTGIGATSYFNGSIRESHLMMNHGTVLLQKLLPNMLQVRSGVILCLMDSVGSVAMR